MAERRTAIVGVDGSERSRDALALASALCAPDSRLLIVHVHPYAQLESLLGEGEYASLVRETTESIFDDVRDVVPDALEREMRLIADPSPAKGLAEAAEDAEAELIVVGSSSRSRLERVLAGSAAEALLSGAPVPVALAPHGYATRSRSSWEVIGCGYNGSVEARAALDLAADLADRLGVALRVVGVHQPFTGVSSSGPLWFESANRALHEVLRRQLDDAAAALAGKARAEQLLLAGDPAATLIEQSRSLDVLVVGSRGYGPVRSVVLGSVSRALARDAACPVIVVPRPGTTS